MLPTREPAGRLRATFARLGDEDRGGGPSGGLAVVIGGRPVGRLRPAGRCWRLQYGAFELTLASLQAAVAFIAVYADRIGAGKPIEEHLALPRPTD